MVNAASTSLTEWRSSINHTRTKQDKRPRDMSVFKKGDRVRAKATVFDGDGRRDRNGMLWSEKWAADKNGEWCYGTVSFVYSRKARTAQKYRVKYDEGTVMEALEIHLERVFAEDESDESEGGNEMGEKTTVTEVRLKESVC